MKHVFRTQAILGTAFLLAVAADVRAQEFSATIVESQCDVVAVSSNAAGAVVGQSVGRVAGSVAAEAIFGRGASGLGGLLGGLGGAIGGDAITKTRTHRCVVTAQAEGVGTIYLETLGSPRNAGQRVTVIRKPSGDYMVKP